MRTAACCNGMQLTKSKRSTKLGALQGLRLCLAIHMDWTCYTFGRVAGLQLHKPLVLVLHFHSL